MKLVSDRLTYSGDSPAIRSAFRAELQKKAYGMSNVTAVAFMSAILVTWPSDFLLFEGKPEVIQVFVTWRVVGVLSALLVLFVPRAFPEQQQHVVAVRLLEFAGLAVLATCGYASSMLGGLDQPFFYPIYGLTMVPALVPVSFYRRAVYQTAFAGSFAVAYFVTNPNHLDSPFLTTVLIVLATCVVMSIVLGQVLTHSQRLNFLANLELKKQALELESAHQQSEKLLLNVLPEPIAEKLKHQEGHIAEAFENVSVLFADIAGFTPLADQLDPGDLVSLLNDVFSEFDNLVEKHGLEKIKTIGDAYMAAAGLPLPRDDHAQAVADMALDMQDVIDSYATPSGDPLQIRIGLNSGAVVAGVIGRKKFIYDLWGDVVNTASRLESHGEATKIQVGQATYCLLEGDYEFQERGLVDLKGKGLSETWWLVGKKNRSS